MKTSLGGKQPAVRQQIEAALNAYIKDEATPEQRAMFRDWSIMKMATLSQAMRFELVHETRPEEDRTIVDAWFRVMRVRAQQNSVGDKTAKMIAKQQQHFEVESQQPEQAA